MLAEACNICDPNRNTCDQTYRLLGGCRGSFTLNGGAQSTGPLKRSVVIFAINEKEMFARYMQFKVVEVASHETPLYAALNKDTFYNE